MEQITVYAQSYWMPNLSKLIVISYYSYPPLLTYNNSDLFHYKVLAIPQTNTDKIVKRIALKAEATCLHTIFSPKNMLQK
jgi:hypothetical protein